MVLYSFNDQSELGDEKRRMYHDRMVILSQLLAKEKIPHKLIPINDGWAIRFDMLKSSDVVCHSFSYGGEDGLFELMGWDLYYDYEHEEGKGGGVIGFLNEQDVLARVKNATNRKLLLPTK